MKRLIIPLLALVLLISGCALMEKFESQYDDSPKKKKEVQPPTSNEEVATPIEADGGATTDEEIETPSEDSVSANSATDSSNKNPEVEEPSKTPEKPLIITAKLVGERYLDAFIDISKSDETRSYLELPEVSGPDIIVNSVNKLLYSGFYTEAKVSWEAINQVQNTKEQDHQYSHISVYQVKTSVFDSEETIVVLAREKSVLGYEMLSKDSKAFYIEKKTGRFFSSGDQLALHGKSREMALETLSKFQKKYTAIDVDEVTKGKLRNKDLGVQKALTEKYSSVTTLDKPLIVNDFSNTEANKYIDVFFVKEGEKEYYVTKVYFAWLGDILNDAFLEEAWVKIPIEDEGGNLERKEDPQKRVDYVYE